MNIIGGTYTEICFEPIWENIYGSGFRAVNLIQCFDPEKEIVFHTCCDSKLSAHLDLYNKLHPKLTINPIQINVSPVFYYDHPLKTPMIFPRPDLYSEDNIKIEVIDENILAYGLLEASIKIIGGKVVYDPQSPANPKSFLSTGSQAKELVIVINFSEAKKISGENEIEKIREFFFDIEKCFALIIKMGPKGALLFETGSKVAKCIPVFQTERVWPIGSGDVFSGFFAYSWFNGDDLHTSARKASMATSIYCNTMDLSIANSLAAFEFSELNIGEESLGQIYLAGPFFTFSERWLINEIWSSLVKIGLKVFSPYHDVGHGKAMDVVQKDLVGLDDSDVVLAVLDGLDSGTLFEIGYAIAKQKKIIVFVQNEDEESLKMLEGTDCILEKDLTTAIYKTYWHAARTK